MREFVLLKILLDDVGVFVPRIDGQYDQAVLLVLVGEPGQVRSLRTAGRSAIGEEGEQDRLAAKIAQLDAPAVEGFELKVLRGLVAQRIDEPLFGTYASDQRNRQQRGGGPSEFSFHACSPSGYVRARAPLADWR